MKFITYNDVLQVIDQFDYIMIDSVIVDLYPQISKQLKSKKVYSVSEPEKHKTIEGFEKATHFFLEKKITRKDQLLAIGGGALSDLSGYVAASLLRGINWSVIPTTLLAMIDASIGGKVGINTIHGKNLIGAFHEPTLNVSSPDFLKTLLEKDYISGVGELVKYCLLDESIFKKIQKDFELEDIIQDCALLKKQIVASDLHENGNRKILNLGHTFGHAIERINSLPHGVGVLYGIEIIIKFFCPQLQSQFDLISRAINVKFPKYEQIGLEEALSYIAVDKKRNKDQSIDLVLLEDIGKVEIKKMQLTEIRKVIRNNEYYSNYFK